LICSSKGRVKLFTICSDTLSAQFECKTHVATGLERVCTDITPTTISNYLMVLEYSTEAITDTIMQ